MKMNVYAVKDVLVGFSQPFFVANDSVAVRMFANSARAKEPNSVNIYPEHKELWKIATYDDQTGEIVNDIVFIAKAIDYVVRGEELEKVNDNSEIDLSSDKDNSEVECNEQN